MLRISLLVIKHFEAKKVNKPFRVLKVVKMLPVSLFIPRREMRSIYSRGPIVVTYVLSPEGRCVAYPVGVQLRLFPFIEFCVRKGILDFKNLKGLSRFFLLENVLSPEGRCVAYPVGVHWDSFHLLNPPKGDA